MTFVAPSRIGILAVVVAALLFGADAALAPRALDGAYRPPEAVHTDSPTLQIWMHRVCCAGCVFDLAEVLAALPHLGPASLGERPASVGGEVEDSEDPLGRALQRVDVPIADLGALDFVQLVETIEHAGFAVEHIHLSGLPHYRLEAELARVDGPSCAGAVDDALSATIAASRPKGFFRWLDSARVDGQTAVFYPRYDAAADLVEVEGALHRTGYMPRSITVAVGD